MYLNDDPGTGPTYGFYMQDNEPAKRIFDGWLAPLRDIGVRRNVIEGINATDHLLASGHGDAAHHRFAVTSGNQRVEPSSRSFSITVFISA